MYKIAEWMNYPCSGCNAESFSVTEKIFDSGLRNEVRCSFCGKFKGWAPNSFLDPKKNLDFKMPFGKYRMKALKEILELDRDYLVWAAINLKQNIAERIKSVLEHRI